jgi:sulfite oxidase
MKELDFSNDPKDRPKTLRIHQSEPFNAEPEDLTEFINHHITPIDLVYGRNHGPIPDIKEDEFKLTINGLVDHILELSLSDLKSMPKTDIVTALQVCLNIN